MGLHYTLSQILFIQFTLSGLFYHKSLEWFSNSRVSGKFLLLLCFTRVVQKVLSLKGFLSFIPGIFYNASLHLNGVLNS